MQYIFVFDAGNNEEPGYAAGVFSLTKPYARLYVTFLGSPTNIPSTYYFYQLRSAPRVHCYVLQMPYKNSVCAPRYIVR